MNTTQTVSASGLHNIATETSGWDMRTCMSTRLCDDTTDFIIKIHNYAGLEIRPRMSDTTDVHVHRVRLA